MQQQLIIKKINMLPKHLQIEIFDFIEHIVKKYRRTSKPKISPQFGSLKGTFKMSEDFDEPLEDFEEYM